MRKWDLVDYYARYLDGIGDTDGDNQQDKYEPTFILRERRVRYQPRNDGCTRESGTALNAQIALPTRPVGGPGGRNRAVL